MVRILKFSSISYVACLPKLANYGLQWQGTLLQCEKKSHIKETALKVSLDEVDRFLTVPSDDEEHAANSQACQQNIHPDIRGEGVEEGEDPRVGAVGFAVQDTDPQRHERLREVYDFLSYISDGQRSHSQVSYLKGKGNEK